MQNFKTFVFQIQFMEMETSGLSKPSKMFTIETISLLISAIGLTLIAIEITRNSMYEDFIIMGIIQKPEMIKTIIGSFLCGVAILIYFTKRFQIKR